MIVAHLLAFVGLACSQPGVPWVAIGSFALIASLFLVMRSSRPDKQVRVVALRLGRAGELMLHRGNGLSEPAAVLAGTTVLPWLVVLRMRLAGRHAVLVIPADAMRRDSHRRLRLWLRWRSQHRTVSPDPVEPAS